MTKDLTYIFENMKKDNDFSFTINFMLQSSYGYSIGGLPNIIRIDNLFSFESTDKDNFVLKFDFINNPREYSVNHGKQVIYY